MANDSRMSVFVASSKSCGPSVWDEASRKLIGIQWIHPHSQILSCCMPYAQTPIVWDSETSNV